MPDLLFSISDAAFVVVRPNRLGRTSDSKSQNWRRLFVLSDHEHVDLQSLAHSTWVWQTIPESDNEENALTLLSRCSSLGNALGTDGLLSHCTPLFKREKDNYFLNLSEESCHKLNAEIESGHEVILFQHPNHKPPEVPKRELPSNSTEEKKMVQGLPKDVLEDAIRFAHENYSETFKKLAE